MCDCQGKPKCQWELHRRFSIKDGASSVFCGKPAAWSMFHPWGSKKGIGQFMFVCSAHYQRFDAIWNDPATWVGIVKPASAGEDWRPSIDEHIRQSIIRKNHEARRSTVAASPEGFVAHLERERHYTPQQQRAIMVLRSRFATHPDTA